MKYKTFVKRCLGCGDYFTGPGDAHFCNACFNMLPVIKGSVCGKCGRPLISERNICISCRERSFQFAENRSIFTYTGLIKDLIIKYKFHNRKHLASWFAFFIAGALGNIEYPVKVVPVPGNPKSVRKRGWDQVREIVKKLNRNYGFTVLDALRRYPSPQQKSLNYSERCANLQDKILQKRSVDGFTGRAVLVDDVFTTGATVNECAKILLKIGCIQVNVLTIAID